MKNIITLYIMIICLFSNEAYGQKLNTKNKYQESRHTVQKLNTPTKMWINVGWEIKNDGSRFWRKGHWVFREKTFQEKSKILRLRENNKV